MVFMSSSSMVSAGLTNFSSSVSDLVVVVLVVVLVVLEVVLVVVVVLLSTADGVSMYCGLSTL